MYNSVFLLISVPITHTLFSQQFSSSRGANVSQYSLMPLVRYKQLFVYLLLVTCDRSSTNSIVILTGLQLEKRKKILKQLKSLNT